MRENKDASVQEAAEESTSEWSKPWFVLSAITVGVILVLGIVLFIVGQINHRDAAPEVTPSVVAPSVAAQGCPLPGSAGTDQSAPATAPKAHWTLYKKIAVPTSANVGPFLSDDKGVKSCFTHSPTGALFAAVNMMALGSQGSHEDQVSLLERFVVPSPARDVELKKTKSEVAGSYGTPQVAGYRMSVQDPDHVQVTLAFSVDQKNAAGTYPLQWTGGSNGDWKIVLTGPDSLPVTPLTDFSGFIPFSGV